MVEAADISGSPPVARASSGMAFRSPLNHDPTEQFKLRMNYQRGTFFFCFLFFLFFFIPAILFMKLAMWYFVLYMVQFEI